MSPRPPARVTAVARAGPAMPPMGALTISGDFVHGKEDMMKTDQVVEFERAEERWKMFRCWSVLRRSRSGFSEWCNVQ